MVFVAESVITEIIPIGKLHLVFDLLSPHILVMGYFLLAVACLASMRTTNV